MHLTKDLYVEEDFSNLKDVILEVKPNWKWSDVKMKALTEGITNKIMGFYIQDDVERTDMVLVRRYGENTDLIIDRKAERRNMMFLHSIGSGSPLYAVLNNALVYGFIPGQITDMQTIRDPALISLVAKEVAKIHYSVDVKSNPDFDTSEPSLFPTFEQFLKVVPPSLSDPVKEAKWQEFGHGGLRQLTQEVKVMKELVEKHAASPLGFTHNDLLLANIVYNEDKTKVHFIDFEYGSYNYVYFDIADHFTEYAGTDEVDHSLYPDEKLQREWITVYLNERNKLLGGAGEPAAVTDDEVEKVRNEVNLLSLCAHLLWALWALIQAEHSKIDFDYVHFAIRRSEGYYMNKEMFTKPFLY